MKRILFTIVLIISTVFLNSCDNNEKNSDMVEVIDFVDDVVSVPKNPKKVAVVSRSAVDMMIAFGLGDKIDGLYKTIFDNPWASYLYPSLNEYYKYEYNENYETFYTRGVDLIIAPEKYIAEDLRSKGLTAITVSQYGSPTYEEVLFRLPDLITSIWDDEEVKNRVKLWRTNFLSVKNKIKDELSKGSSGENTLYYIRGDKYKGLNYTETKGSIIETFGNYLNLKFIGEFFDHNNRPSEETVLELNPSIIIVGGIYQNQLISELRGNDAWNKLDAVKNEKVFNIGIGFVMFEQTSVEETIFLASLANSVYPEIFSFDINTMIMNTIKNFFGVELSELEIHYMLNGLDKDGNSLV
ncbi:MAG: ABC transporter substrate-binding protein [Acholeplasma sp.]|nr:ABC transporter substrate-binding protein [Acholeplasma sp.]